MLGSSIASTPTVTEPTVGVESEERDDILDALQRWREDPVAADRLVCAIYTQLTGIARRQLASRPDAASLQPSDLAQEALLYLLTKQRSGLRSRTELFAVAALLMRRVLVARSRRRLADKRGGGHAHVPLEASTALAPAAHPDMLALDAALAELATIDELSARLVELRYFVGLSLEEAAAALGVGRTSVVHRWRFARAWLRDRLQERVSDPLEPERERLALAPLQRAAPALPGKLAPLPSGVLTRLPS